MKKSEKSIPILFIVISATLFLSSSAFAELDDFDVAETLLMQGKAKLAYPLATAHAKNLNSYESYRTFVRKFPDAPRTPEMLQSAFEKVKDINTEAGYDDFIRIAAQSVLAFRAIEAQFRLFRDIDTIGEYRRFISKFPNTPEAAEAMTRIQEIAFTRAKEENTSAIFDRFIIAFPHAPQTEQARKLAYQAEQRELDTELGEGVQRTSLGGGSPQEKRETAARRIYNEARMAEKKRELLYIAERKYELLQSMFRDTKAFTDLLDRQEQQAYRQEVKAYNEQIISEVRSVKGAVKEQTTAVAAAFRDMETQIRSVKDAVDNQTAEVKAGFRKFDDDIRNVRASVSQTQAELDNVKGSVSRTQSDLSYLSGSISSAMRAQVDAINEANRAEAQRHYDNERANREASRQADQMRYANERMFRESQERASEESRKNRRCAEELARKGKYGIWSGCP